MEETIKYTQKIECFHCHNIIEKDIEIVVNSKENKQSKIDFYCPFCDKFLEVDVKGELAPNTQILRGSSEK